MKSQSIAYLLRESECSYCIFCLQGEVHSTWDLCKGDLFFIVRQGVQTIVDWDQKKKTNQNGETTQRCWIACPSFDTPFPHDGSWVNRLGTYLNGMSSSPNHIIVVLGHIL